MMKTKRLKIGADTERMLRLGHPWVIADKYTRQWPPCHNGEIAELCSPDDKPLAIALIDPHSRIVARVLDRPEVRIDAHWLGRKFLQAMVLRKDHVDLAQTDTCRLVNAEGDYLPGLTVERYGDFLMAQLYTESWQPHIKMIAQALRQTFDCHGAYLKYRPQQTRKLEAQGGAGQLIEHLFGEEAPGELTVRENGLCYRIDLDDGLHTGLFLDQRENRRDFMTRVGGKRVLNLFSYTGAFSVAAAVGGASQVVSVDVSEKYLQRARTNFTMNGITVADHQFITADCLRTLRHMLQKGEQFDVILVDPPSFSTTKKGKFSTRGGTAELVTAALGVLKPGGLLVTSSNHQKVTLDDYLKELRRGALAAETNLHVLEVRGQGPDFSAPVTFPEGRYLKYVLAVRD